ncbi:MAG: altronate dehydratase family protein [Oscillospiraceae bacterium]|nr:altronate dehydratase family protein [Oscillospiraceae bacterium]
MQVIKINGADNVIVAINAVSKGFEVKLDGVSIIVNHDVPAGHKIAICDIDNAQPVIKYGERIGFAKGDIKTGDWVHVHNLKTALSGKVEYTYNPVDVTNSPKATMTPRTFNGFLRENGTAGVRNEVWIIPTVGCVNGTVKLLEQYGRERLKEKFATGGSPVNELIAFPHPYGCSQMGEDQENTRKVLANLVNHPNAGAVLVVGLGCENSGVGILKDYIGQYNPDRVKFLIAQDHDDEVAVGEKLLDELIEHAAMARRTELPVSKLVIGLKCGGSDGFSGITANPVVGEFSDLLVSMGGTSILTEVPEMFGAEQILMNRAKDGNVYNEIVSLINNFKEYYEKADMPIYENPSPGNKAGGISTLEDKSLGCTQKSGTSPVCGVSEYGERVKTNGLNLLCAPGNDLIAATALAAAGAQIVLFTTGRGTPFASPVPTVKISSNTALFTKKAGWIDFNTGYAVDGTRTITQLSADLLDFVIETANGKLIKSEELKLYDMAIFKTGVTL